MLLNPLTFKDIFFRLNCLKLNYNIIPSKIARSINIFCSKHPSYF